MTSRDIFVGVRSVPPQSSTESPARGFWMSVTSRPCRNIEIVPVDCDTQSAIAVVVLRVITGRSRS